MNERLRQFWQSRYAKHGHTGWSDSTIYAYDQLERIAIVEHFIRGLVPAPKKALDYGCGSGDFSRLLLRSGLRVWGFDPFVQPRLREAGFTYVPSLDAVAKIPAGLDLILSVTVLDHVLNDGELLNVLRLLRDKIAPSGTLLLVEYAFEGKVTRPPNDYQALRRIEDWRRLLDGSGWAIASGRPVPTIPESPSEGFLAFRSSLRVRLLRKFVNLGGPGANTARGLLLRYARHVLKRHGPGEIQHSPLKLFLCSPVKAGREANCS